MTRSRCRLSISGGTPRQRHRHPPRCRRPGVPAVLLLHGARCASGFAFGLQTSETIELSVHATLPCDQTFANRQCPRRWMRWLWTTSRSPSIEMYIRPVCARSLRACLAGDRLLLHIRTVHEMLKDLFQSDNCILCGDAAAAGAAGGHDRRLGSSRQEVRPRPAGGLPVAARCVSCGQRPAEVPAEHCPAASRFSILCQCSYALQH